MCLTSITMPDDHQVYDSDVNIVLPTATDYPGSDSSCDYADNDIDYADDDVVGRVLANTDPTEYEGFYGVRSTEFEACFACLPADNGHLYFAPGTIT